MTPDGALWVDIYAISHTHRGKDSRGKALKDRWTFWYWVTTEDGQKVNQCRTLYYEAWEPLKAAGWDIEPPYGKRIELEGPIPVVIEAVGDKYRFVQVGQAEKVSIDNG